MTGTQTTGIQLMQAVEVEADLRRLPLITKPGTSWWQQNLVFLFHDSLPA